MIVLNKITLDSITIDLEKQKVYINDFSAI